VGKPASGKLPVFMRFALRGGREWLRAVDSPERFGGASPTPGRPSIQRSFAAIGFGVYFFHYHPFRSHNSCHFV
jgi:hypothetical protein